MKLPQAPRTPLDRIAFAAHRWTETIHKRDAGFAAACAEIAARFDSPDARENAKRVLRLAQAKGYLNGRELITSCDTLTIWEGAEPGHKMAVCVALTEIGGGKAINDVKLRTLTHPLYR